MSTRHRSTRRAVLRTIGSLGMATAASATTGAADAETSRSSSSNGARSRRSTAGCGSNPVSDPDTAASRYVATVDRIVDGRHVVLLLEDDGELVDQHVVPRSRLEWVAEGDILLVVLEEDDLRVVLPLPKRPGRSPTDPSPQERFDSLATDGSG